MASIKIPFSPANPGLWPITAAAPTQLWPEVAFEEGKFRTWKEEAFGNANEKVSTGNSLIFQAVVFRKSDLLKITAQTKNDDPCVALALSHLLIETANGQTVSTLLAIGENIDGDDFGYPDSQFFVGTPIRLVFEPTSTMKGRPINLLQGYPGYTWKKPAVTDATLVNKWMEAVKQSHQNEINKKDYGWKRCRIEKDIADPLFATGPELVAFSVGVVYCKVAKKYWKYPNVDPSGNYCTLIGYDLKPGPAPEQFFVCTDTYSPNWPR